MGLKNNGDLYAWGENRWGQLGNGGNASSSTPIQVASDQNWGSVKAGLSHSVAVTTSGSLYVWGYNENGELSDSNSGNIMIPVRVGENNAWSSVQSAGYGFSIAMKTDTSLFSMGANHFGQLGDGTAWKAFPVLIKLFTVDSDNDGMDDHLDTCPNTPGGESIDANGCSDSQKDSDNDGVTDNLDQCPGTTDGAFANSEGCAYYQRDDDEDGVKNNIDVCFDTPPSASVDANGCSDPHQDLDDDGIINDRDACPTSPENELIGINGCSASEIRMSTALVTSKYDHSLFISPEGSLYAWGKNEYGQLGDGTMDDKTIPTPIGNPDSRWIAVSSGYDHTMAIKDDGTLYGWGNNEAGVLGLEIPGDSELSPTQVGSDNDWAQISSGSSFNIAIKTDGSLYAWGDNYYGELGDGTTTEKSSPVRIGQENDWISVSAGDMHCLALKSDGTLHAWGQNDFGQLGDGTYIPKTIQCKLVPKMTGFPYLLVFTTAWL